MKRLLVPFLAAAAALAAGCGAAGSGSSGSSDDPAALLRQSARALQSAHGASFTMSAKIGIEGGTAAALGDSTVKLSGRTGEKAFDVKFEVGVQGMSLTGEALSPDGKTAYIQMPMVLGPGWYSVDMGQAAGKVEDHGKQRGADPGNAKQRRIAREVLALLHPEKWLDNVSVTHPGGSDRIEGDLAVRGVVDDVLAAAVATAKKEGESVTGTDLDDANAEIEKTLPKIEKALRRAHGSVTLDADSHLPEALAADIDVQVPEDMRSATDPSAVSLALRFSFSDWNEAISVKAPANAKPLDLNDLGALGSGAFPLGAAA
jgi:hypothetical protein